MRAAAVAANTLPDMAAVLLAQFLGRVAARTPVFAPRVALVARHQRRILGDFADGRAQRRAVSEAFASYGRYWMESLRVGQMAPELINARFSIEGLGHIEAALSRG
ncbi:MAG: hypothetical protein ACRDRT_13940, partial [Pseudonocardiaceae bacterium]